MKNIPLFSYNIMAALLLTTTCFAKEPSREDVQINIDQAQTRMILMLLDDLNDLKSHCVTQRVFLEHLKIKDGKLILGEWK